MAFWNRGLEGCEMEGGNEGGRTIMEVFQDEVWEWS